jgi:hypothetical protein
MYKFYTSGTAVLRSFARYEWVGAAVMTLQRCHGRKYHETTPFISPFCYASPPFSPTFPYNPLATLITRTAVTLTTSLPKQSLGGVNNKQVGEPRQGEITEHKTLRAVIHPPPPPNYMSCFRSHSIVRLHSAFTRDKRRTEIR